VSIIDDTLHGGTATIDLLANGNGTGSQTVTASGDVLVENAFGWGGLAEIGAFRFGNQTVTSTSGNISVETAGSDGFEQARILLGSNGVDQTVQTLAGNLTIGNLGTGRNATASITSDGTGAQLAEATGGNITVESGSGNDTTAEILASDATATQSVTDTAGTVSVLGGSGKNGVAQIELSDGTAQTVTAGTLVITGGSAMDSVASIIDASGNQTVNVYGNATVTGGSAAGTLALIARTASTAGTQSITVNNNLSLEGGSGEEGTFGAALIETEQNTTTTIYAGGNVIILANDATNDTSTGLAAGIYQGLDGEGTAGSLTIVAGKSVTVTGGTIGEAGIVADGNLTIVSLANQTYSAGDGGVRVNAGNLDTDSTATLIAGGNILFVGGAGTVDAISGGDNLGGTNLGVTIAAGGDVQLPASISTTTGNVVITADAAFAAGALFAANANPVLVGTPLAAGSVVQPSDGLGGILNQSLNGSAPLTITTISGDIGLITASRLTDSTFDRITIGQGENEVSLGSTTGNIIVDPPTYITVDGNLFTGGDIILVAQKDVILTGLAQVISNGSSATSNILIIADNQNPSGLMSNVPENGSFQSLAGSMVEANGRIEIYSASPTSDVFKGTIVGYAGVPNPYFDNSQTLFHVVYDGPGFPFALPFAAPFTTQFPLLGDPGSVGVYFKIQQSPFEINQPFPPIDTIELDEGFGAGYEGFVPPAGNPSGQQGFVTGYQGSGGQGAPAGSLAFASSYQLPPIVYSLNKAVYLPGSAITAGQYGSILGGPVCPVERPDCLPGGGTYGGILPVNIPGTEDTIWAPQH
jgi:hypothetical protein